MSSLRFKAVEEAFKKKAIAVTPPSKFASDYYGKYVFNGVTMEKYLSKDTLKAVKNVINKGATLDLAVSASSFLPSFISMPIDLDRLLTSERLLSNLFCALRLLSFNAMT